MLFQARVVLLHAQLSRSPEIRVRRRNDAKSGLYKRHSCHVVTSTLVRVSARRLQQPDPPHAIVLNLCAHSSLAPRALRPSGQPASLISAPVLKWFTPGVQLLQRQAQLCHLNSGVIVHHVYSASLVTVAYRYDGAYFS